MMSKGRQQLTSISMKLLKAAGDADGRKMGGSIWL